MRPLARDLARQRKHATTALERLDGLSSVAARRDEFDDLLADQARREERADRAAVVCLVGSTGAGKSTLLNALAGSSVADEGVTRPTTVDPTVYLPSDADPGAFTDLGCKLVTYEPGPEGAWSGQVFIDAPDWNSFATAHRDTARRMVERSDVLVVVAHRQSIKEKVAIEFLAPFANKRRHMVFVLGRADELRSEDRTKLVGQIREVARAELGFGDDEDPNVFAIDARTAQTNPEAAAGFSAFVKWLHGLADDAILEQIRRSGLQADQARMRDLAAAARRETMERLEDLPAQLERAVRSAGTAVRDDARAELDLRLNDLERQLADEVGARWRGPGGLALRFGGWTGGGLGLAMLVARRHPITGAAAAGAGAVTGLASRWLRKHRLGRDLAANQPTLSEGGDKHARTLRIPMQDLEVAAARAFVDRDARDTALGPEVFDPTAHAAVLDEAVHESWTDALRRDLPTIARTAMPAGVRLLFDLPAYALVVHAIGFHVLYGYLTGNPAGLDFIVNAILVAGLWAVAVRWLARLWLRRHARRVADTLQERIDAELTAVAAASAADLRRRVDRIATAFDEVAEPAN